MSISIRSTIMVMCLLAVVSRCVRSYSTIAPGANHFRRPHNFAQFPCSIRRITAPTNTRLFNSDSHQSSSSAPALSPEDEQLLMKLRENQKNAPRLTYAEEVRTLMQQSIGFGVLATNSDQFNGYPTGSVVGFSLNEKGLPYFVFSTMSAHTKDIAKDGRVSLTVMASDFKGAAEGRVVLIGDIAKVTDPAKVSELRDGYLAKHKDAYWIDFGDFSYFSMESILAIRFIGGFAMAGSVAPEEYSAATPDPIAPFSSPVMKHMNDDHSDTLISMLKHYAGVPCSEASIVSMDRLGMVVKARLEVAGKGYSKIRLPYPRPVTDRKAIKEILVEMTKASTA